MQNELFEKMPVPKAYMKLALPMMISSVLMLVYNMVDMYFIAGTGNTNLVAGVSLCAPIFTFMIAIGDIFGLGGSSLISRLFGQGKMEDGKRLSVFSFLGGAVFGLVIGILLYIFKNPMLTLLGATDQTRSYALQYYSWIVLGAPFVIFSLVPSNLLRTEGFATGAMIGSVLGSVVNMILDPIFIFTLGMGAGGAAAATVIGNICADIFYVWFITHKSKALSLNPKGFYIKMRELKQILGIGIPSSITNIMSSIAVMLLNRFLLPYGNDKIAAMGIVSKIVLIVVMVTVSFSFAGQPMYGYLFGAGNKKRMKETIRFSYMIVCGLGLALSIVLSIFAPQMVAVFMDDPSIIATGTPMLRIVLVGMFFIGITMVTTCIFQSTGKGLGALTLSAGRQGYIYFLVLLIGSKLFGYMGVIAAQPAADVLTSILAIILFKKLLGQDLAE